MARTIILRGRVLLYGDVSDFVVPVHLREPTGYFIWQKDPFETGEGTPNTEGLNAGHRSRFHSALLDGAISRLDHARRT